MIYTSDGAGQLVEPIHSTPPYSTLGSSCRLGPAEKFYCNRLKSVQAKFAMEGDYLVTITQCRFAGCQRSGDANEHRE
jgi:hypothetical protein